jgi:hypothetical protein
MRRDGVFGERHPYRANRYHAHFLSVMHRRADSHAAHTRAQDCLQRMEKQYRQVCCGDLRGLRFPMAGQVPCPCPAFDGVTPYLTLPNYCITDRAAVSIVR